MKKISVLFVCLGNICRSPAAEGAFLHLLEEKNLLGSFQVDSAGTGDWHTGELPHEMTRKVAESRGIRLIHKARQFKTEDTKLFDYIIAMDDSNYRTILRAASEEDKEKIMKFRKFDPTVNGEPDVPDPFYGGVSGFEHVQDIVERCSENFLKWAVQKHPAVLVPKENDE